MAVLRRAKSNSYTRIDKEDPDEVHRRRAQFLIYKTLDKADSPRRRRLKICKLKIRIGKRFKNLRKSIVVNVYATKVLLYKQIFNHLITFKLLFTTTTTTSHHHHGDNNIF
ncbi:hypothetical protein ACFE04_002744 [Oxalis oulophora]